jgi:hypothetical protein
LKACRKHSNVNRRYRPQSFGVRSRFFNVCLPNAPCYGSLSQRDPSDTGQLAGGKTQRWLEDLLRWRSDDPDESKRHDEAAPAFVEPVPWYESDVMALKALTEPLLPPMRHVRFKVVFTVAYGFAHANGEGFERTITVDGCLILRSGQWK